MKNSFGFTLMELMIVVIIVAILVTLALPVYHRTVERSRMSEAYLHLEAIKNAELAYYNKYNTYALLLNDLTVDNPNNLPVETRYFDYAEIIPQYPSGGFSIQCTRNDTNNVLSFDYYIYMNQDGKIETNFYSGP